MASTVHPRSRSAGTLVLLGLLLASGCRQQRDEPAVAVDYFTWVNPITAASVPLPEGWRHSPEDAARGPTTVGYFAPNFAQALHRYGHITLHYEYLNDPASPMTLERFVDNFWGYMRHLARREDGPHFARAAGLATADLTLRAEHDHRVLLLQVRFWTPDNRDYWYAVIERTEDDARFAALAAPVVDLLVRSTLPPPF